MRKSGSNIGPDWVDIHEALSCLTVKRETLYAYVSRGHVRSRPMPGDHRASLYALPDVQRMAKKRRRPRKRAEVAKSTIRWGEPIMETRISTVRDGELIFGTRTATDLANTYTLEDIAAHHWRCESNSTLQFQPCFKGITPFERGLGFLAREASLRDPILKRKRNDLAQEAMALLSGLADSMMGTRYDGCIHSRLAQHWQLDPGGSDLIRRALVLISDHELNASTFAVRVAASTGATLSASVLAGLCALSGPLHGNATERATNYLRDAIQIAEQEISLTEYIDENPAIPGMGHPLYPKGDSRAKALLHAIQSEKPITDALATFEDFSGHPPDIDMAHAALSLTLGLPKGAGFMIFAIGRMVGWLAHAMEQNERGELIRPRADFSEDP